jgi:hypothetical protein
MKISTVNFREVPSTIVAQLDQEARARLAGSQVTVGIRRGVVVVVVVGEQVFAVDQRTLIEFLSLWFRTGSVPAPWWRRVIVLPAVRTAIGLVRFLRRLISQ